MIKIPKEDIYGLSKTTCLDKDKLGKTLYAFDSKSFHSPPFDLDINAETQVMYYKHIYKTNIDGSWRKHMCLQRGAWCWQQARRHPIEALGYLRRSLI